MMSFHAIPASEKVIEMQWNLVYVGSMYGQ